MAVTKVQFPQQTAGMQWTVNKANEFREVINNNADELTALQSSVATFQQADNNTPQVTQSQQTVTISPNVLNVWPLAVASLNITLGAAVTGKANEYMLQFVVSGDNFTLSLPNGIRWLEEPEWEAGYTYQVSILNGLAITAGWEAAAQ